MRFPRAETGGGCRFERTVMAGAGRINGAIGVKGIRLDCFSFTRASTASFRGTAELDRGPESAPCHSGDTAELDGAPESAPFEGSGEEDRAPASAPCRGRAETDRDPASALFRGLFQMNLTTAWTTFAMIFIGPGTSGGTFALSCPILEI